MTKWQVIRGRHFFEFGKSLQHIDVLTFDSLKEALVDTYTDVLDKYVTKPLVDILDERVYNVFVQDNKLIEAARENAEDQLRQLLACSNKEEEEDKTFCFHRILARTKSSEYHVKITRVNDE